MAPVDALAMDPVYMPDQTTPPPVRTICVTSGKGGVGKTTVAVNLALALIGSGKRVMLLDADLGLANVDVMLGLGVRRTLGTGTSLRCRSPSHRPVAWHRRRQHFQPPAPAV